MGPQHNTSATRNGSGKLRLCELDVLQLREVLIPLCSVQVSPLSGLCCKRDSVETGSHPRKGTGNRVGRRTWAGLTGRTGDLQRLMVVKYLKVSHSVLHV